MLCEGVMAYVMVLGYDQMNTEKLSFTGILERIAHLGHYVHLNRLQT